MDYFWKYVWDFNLTDQFKTLFGTLIEVNIQKRATLKAEEDLYRAKIGSGKL